MKIGIAGASSQERSLPFNAERSVNLFPVIDQDGKEVASMYGTPGLSVFSNVGTGQVRQVFKSNKVNRAFAIIGSIVYEISSTGGFTNRGNLLQSAGNVSIEENDFELAICDGSNVYILNYETNSYSTASLPSGVRAGTITFIDGYFVINDVSTGKYYISGLYDGLSWNSLDFASAESSPDNLVRVYNAVGQLWLFGTITTEIHTNTGGSGFPFEKIPGAKLDVGCLAPHSVVDVSGTIFWLGTTKYGQGTVYQANGFSPQPISTQAIDKAIQRSTNVREIVGYTYEEEGHTFYVLTGGGLETSLVYDITTRIWHERAFLNQFGNYETHLAYCHMFALDKHIVGVRRTGILY